MKHKFRHYADLHNDCFVFLNTVGKFLMIFQIFLIYGKKNFTRGDHAHRKCKQFLVPIMGKMEVIFNTDDIDATEDILSIIKEKNLFYSVSIP